MKHVLGLFAVLVLAVASAQADNIVFDVEILRVEADGSFTRVETARPGETIEYRVTATNVGDVIYRPGTVVATVPISDGVSYIEGTATPTSDGLRTAFSADGGRSFSEPPVAFAGGSRVAPPDEYDAIRWTFDIPFEPGQVERVSYRVRVDDAADPVAPGDARSVVDGFRFDRLGILDAGGGFVQFVGEVSSAAGHETVAFRVTLYDASGDILATETFIVDGTGPTPRTFDTLISRVELASVADFSVQVEWVR